MLTMAEYIERDALMLRIKEIHCAECDSYNGLRCRACLVDDALDYIDSEPAADVATVRHGRWVCGDYYDVGDVCSECDWDSQMICTSYRYCPNCGAKMDGDENG